MESPLEGGEPLRNRPSGVSNGKWQCQGRDRSGLANSERFAEKIGFRRVPFLPRIEAIGAWCDNLRRRIRVSQELTPTERAFAARAVRRGRLFLVLSIAGIVIAAGLAIYYGVRKVQDPSFSIGARGVILVLILLNARQNLRQYRFAQILEKIAPGAA